MEDGAQRPAALARDPPPGATVDESRLLRGGGAHLREILGLKEGGHAPPTAAILDGRVLRSTPESGHRAGYSGAKRKAFAGFARRVQEETGDSVELAYVDQGYTGPSPAASVEEHDIRLEVVRLPEAKRGFVLLTRRWAVERSFAWARAVQEARQGLREAARDLAGFHVLALCTLMRETLAPWIQGA